MLEHKGIAYRRTDLIPVVSKVVLRSLGFPRTTAPAMKLDGERVQGSREISRALERARPEPPLFPADPEERTAVEDAERFGEEGLQPPVRRILWWALKRDRSPLRSYAEGARLGVPIDLAMATAGPLVALSARFNEASDENVRRDMAALPELLARVDEWVEAGVLGGERLTAADFQIVPSIALAMTLDDLRPLIESRPAGALARRVVPDYPGKTPPILPPAWLQPLRSEAAGV